MACWITTAAMLFSWRDQTNTTPEELAKRLGNPWFTLFREDIGLPREQYFEFIKAAGLRFEWPANHLPIAYVEFLKRYGPLWITTSDSASSHARLLIAVRIEGDDADMTFVDPATGRESREQFFEFFADFEREARLVVSDRPNIDLPIQIVHLP